MPCSSPQHAALHLEGGGLSACTYVWPKQFIQERVLGSGERLNRPESSNKRKGTCSRINSYFDPSVGSVWGSLMSICLAGISLAPGNPTGFLWIGEDLKVVRLELRRETHSEAACRMSEGETPDGSGCLDVCVCVSDMCEVKGSVRRVHTLRLRQGQALMGVSESMLVLQRTWGASRSSEGRAHSTRWFFFHQWTKTIMHRQHIDKGQTVRWEDSGGFSSDLRTSGCSNEHSVWMTQNCTAVMK